jgi:hypothetical protein
MEYQNPRLACIVRSFAAAKRARSTFNETEVYHLSPFRSLGSCSHAKIRALTRFFETCVLNPSVSQAGCADLSRFGCLVLPADFEAIRIRRQVERLTGTHVRNQAYYDLATASGVHGAGNNVPAPAYIIAAVEAAVPWGKHGIPGLIPVADCDRLESSPAIAEADLQAALRFIREMDLQIPSPSRTHATNLA